MIYFLGQRTLKCSHNIEKKMRIQLIILICFKVYILAWLCVCVCVWGGGGGGAKEVFLGYVKKNSKTIHIASTSGMPSAGMPAKRGSHNLK